MHGNLLKKLKSIHTSFQAPSILSRSCDERIYTTRQSFPQVLKTWGSLQNLMERSLSQYMGGAWRREA